MTTVAGIALPAQRASMNSCKRTSPIPSARSHRTCRVKTSRGLVVKALNNPNEPQKKLTRESEPEQYWQSEAEKEGKSPFEDPMAIAALSGLVIPFTILAIAIGSGYIELQ